MDALTNVVAVLILVLILVQADVSRKVQQFIDDLAPATPEDIAQSLSRITELERQQSIAAARLMEKPPSPQEITAIETSIADLEKNIQQINQSQTQLAEVRKLESQVRENLNKEITLSDELTKEIERLNGRLEALPAIDPDTPTVVNIPNTRPIPENAKTYYAITVKDRVHIINPYTHLAVFQREFDRRKNDWLINRVKVKGKADKFFYDGVKIANHFKTFNWGATGNQKIEILASPTSWNLQLVIRPDLEKGGTPVDSLTDPNSDFVKNVIPISRDFSAVLLYQVHSNSFKSYLAARELTEKVNLAAGWEIKHSQDIRITIPDIAIKRLQEPKKPGGDAPPKPPTVKPKLD